MHSTRVGRGACAHTVQSQVAILIKAHHTHHSLHNSRLSKYMLYTKQLYLQTLTLGSKIPRHFIVLVHIQFSSLEGEKVRTAHWRQTVSN